MSQNKKYKKNKQVDSTISDEAVVIAQGIKQENQTKSQTKLVAQGIRKGIELYKNQQNNKQRQADKKRKKELKSKFSDQTADTANSKQYPNNSSILKTGLPWSLLIISWIFFVTYFYVAV